MDSADGQDAVERPGQRASSGVYAEDPAKAFRLSDPWMHEHCYEVFRDLRERCPVGWSDELGGYWVVSDYATASAILRNTEVFSSREISVPKFQDSWGPMLPQQTDPPEHGLYRLAINKLLSPPRVRTFEPRARQIAQGLLKEIRANRGGDLKADFCIPFTSTANMEYLGFAHHEISTFLDWNHQILAALPPADPALQRHVDEHVKPEIYRYLAGILTDRANQADAPDDVITGLTRARFGDRQYSLDEQVRTLYLLINASLDTTNNVLGMSLCHLATHPDHIAELVHRPELVPAAVEEFARYFNNTTVARLAVKDITINRTTFREGDMVQVLLPSACRDDAVFGDGDTIRFDRATNRHISFSVGPHRCAGSHLARMELRVAIEEILRILPDMRLKEGTRPVFRSSVVRKIEQIEIETTGLVGAAG